MPSIRRAVAVAAVAVVVALPGCSKEPEQQQTRPIISDYVTDAAVLGPGATLEVRAETLPEGDAGGPTLTVRSEATVVNGGSLIESVTASDPFTRLRVGIGVEPPPSGPGASEAPPPEGGTGPAPGYYELTLREAATVAQLVLTVAQALPGTSFVFHYAAVTANGTQGRLVRERVSVLTVGTGQVQVSVSWDTDSDVDLHVVDPNNDEVYFEQPAVDSGGELDLDSNSECQLDHKKNENITWASAPPGPYLVRADYWSSCGASKTSYVVTVRVGGAPAKVFNGEFTGRGDEGGLGSGKEITTFTVTGPTPTG